ncbi:FixH family protein [Candidatus Oscillochloris fontis]|uniref:FixH family protein n=1 Tax=Candidatus Oscillochloris fontis TaxID=2496868 RepID=UPI00101D79DD|nr:FixH family protein [Candidatus Oscillochloris fontis]
MHPWRTRIVLALLLLLGLVGCGGVALPPLPADMVRDQRVSEEVTFTLDYTSNPRINYAQQLRLTLRDAHGQPVEAESVYFDLGMDMICLSGSKPVAKALGQGTYEVTTVYVMAGDWRVIAVAELGDREVAAIFPLLVNE